MSEPRTWLPKTTRKAIDECVDAILRDGFQGKRDHMRDQLRAIGYRSWARFLRQYDPRSDSSSWVDQVHDEADQDESS